MEVRRASRFRPKPARTRALHIADFGVKILADVGERGVQPRSGALPIAAEIPRVRPDIRASRNRIHAFKRARPQPPKIHLIRRTIDKIDTACAVLDVSTSLMNGNHAEAGTGEKIAFHSQHRIVRAWNVHRIDIFCCRCGVFIREDVQKPNAVVAYLAGDFSACKDRYRVLFRNADAAAIEKQKRWWRVKTSARNAEIKNASTLQEELTFFREKEAKPREVRLLLVCLNLGKIGIHGEVSCQIGGDANLRVRAQVKHAVRVIGVRASHTREQIGQKLNVASG